MALRQRKKLDLVEVASTLFREQGYCRVSLSDIAEAADMHQGNVYYYFKTKKELASAVLKHCDEMLREVFSSLEAEGPGRRLVLFLNYIADQTEAYARWGCPVAGLSTDMMLECRDETQASFPNVYKTYLSWFKQNLKELGLSSNRAEKESQLLLSGLQGAIHVAHILDDASILQRFVALQKRQIKHFSTDGSR